MACFGAYPVLEYFPCNAQKSLLALLMSHYKSGASGRPSTGAHQARLTVHPSHMRHSLEPLKRQQAEGTQLLASLVAVSADCSGI